jgi:hypothetical protein
MLLDRERAKIQRDLTRFTYEWADTGVSIVFDGWANIRNQHLINVLCVLASGAVFLVVHDSWSITSSAQNILELLLKIINDVGPSNVIQVITDNVTNCRGVGKVVEWVHAHIFWCGCLVHTLNLLIHDIVKHKDCGWINDLSREGRNSSNLSSGIQGSITFMVLTPSCICLRLQRLDLVAISSPLGAY